MVVVNTGGAASEPGPAMAAVVRNMASAAGVAGGGSRPELRLPDCSGRGWGCVVEGNPAAGLCPRPVKRKEFPSNLLLALPGSRLITPKYS